MRAEAVDVLDRPRHPVDDPHREDGVEVFGAPIRLRRRDRRGLDRQGFRVAAQFAAGGAQVGEDRRQDRGGDRTVDQQGLGRAADRHPPHLGVEHDGARLRGVGGAVDIGVAQPFEMGDDRDAALALHPLDQRRPAARHDDVDDPAHLQHQAHRLAVAGRHQLDRVFREPRRMQPLAQRGDQRARRMKAFRAAAQDRRVARFDGEPTGVGGDVRAALVDDADDPERHADARDVEPVGPGPLGEHPANRIGQRGNVLEPARHRFQPLRIEGEAVDEGGADPGVRRLCNVLGVGGEDFAGALADRSGRRPKRPHLGFGRDER